MDWSNVLVTVITTLGTVTAAALGYWGLRFTARSSRQANAETREAEAEQTRLQQAWPELLDSIRTEFVEPLREEVGRERQARQELGDELDDERKARQDLGREVDKLTRRVGSLSAEVQRWQQTARTLARWGLRLRDQVIALGGVVPADPDELITLRVIEDAAGDDTTDAG